MKRLALVPVAAVLLGSCSDSSPTAPPAVAAGPPTLSVAGSVDVVSIDYSPDLNDLKNRVLPGFPDQGVAARLGERFDELSTQLMAGDVEGATHTLARAREIAQPGVTSWGDLGAINLVLDMIGRALAQR